MTDDFELLENVKKLSYVLGSELWESSGLVSFVMEYIVIYVGNTKT